MSKLITVFGATGNQGGSVVRAILADATLSREFKIRGVTRDTSKPAAKALAEKGVEVVTADLASPASVTQAVTGADTVFLVTNFWDSMSEDTEFSQGKAVTDASKAAGVKHLVFSSLRNVTEITGGRMPHVTHFDGKAKIEQYMRDSGVPATFVLPGMFMSNFYTMIKKQEGVYTLAWPVNPDTAKAPLISIEEDFGKYVKIALKQYPSAIGKRILAATDYYSPTRLITEFSEVTGHKAQAVQIPAETFKSFMSAPVAQELLENFLLLDDVGYYGGESLEETKKLLEDEPVSWKDFVARNKGRWP
ncbi:hypothetical protein BGW36DRAFT_399447 [Talaromyces proteolyticus]|uniref:NmrA-like domain-containing protein n=1 Tax=Talaromyces proteolyticus TaxID=1131652 RepID=A0AAD4KNP6_9EURO|nr:uncharacterized protein BGW36DRAFT_399447 [Talaromyces proteolyticus]KAH8692616.1 hypothetical protein BGW36DRAFT_399447 [Talaromyces proteolyticus]